VRRVLLPALALALALTAAGCGGDEESGSDTTVATAAAAGNDCTKAGLGDTLVSSGKLTIGTDNPAYPPWFDGGTPKGSKWKINDPSTGKGFESAVAYAVAKKLGFAPGDVTWIVVPFNQSFKPGAKNFDFDINQISFAPERDKAVDFSESYYDVNQALVATKGTPIASAKSRDGLKKYKLGAQIGTTSYRYITDNIKPDAKPSVYDTSNDVISGLKAKQIDGIVVDLPTAFFIVAAELDNGTIVGQFPTVGEQEHFGMVFEDGSKLVDCVDSALDDLKADGTLARIQQEWLSNKANAPVLQ
jgi:polar amino acid transport system substrate-binding protein